MVNLNSVKNNHDETTHKIKSENTKEECNTLIWTMKAGEYIAEENQENMSRVHVLCCDKCDFLTISLKALQHHLLVLHSLPAQDFDNLIIYSCQECKCVSTEIKLIQEHIKIFHNISTENSSNSSKSEKVTKKTNKLLTQTSRKNCRKSTQIKLVKNQLKIRKKIFKRKSLKIKFNNFLSSDVDIEDNNDNDSNNNSFSVIKRENKHENMLHNERMEMGENDDENDPLDMSMNSTTCPFKGIKNEARDCSNFDYPMKQESNFNENYDNGNNNSLINNPLLSNPQTCIELIKLTLSQMFNKSTEQNRLSHIGFNPSSFLQPQFQLPSNIVPLILPTSSQMQTNTQNEITFTSKNQDIENLLANMQQQNLLKSVSPKSFDQNSQMIGFQQSPIYLNHKLTGSSNNVNKGIFIESTSKNGNFTISPLPTYNQKKSGEYQCKTSNKRSLKKQPLPTKVRNGLNDDLGFLQNSKFETPKSESEILFNRSFLDTSEMDTSTEQLDLSKVLEAHDNLESHTNLSNKSSPNTNDKPHRQNFTSQQNRILSDWFFTHCDKPYPSTEDTKELSQLSGLTYSQVKKWFANKRARSSLNKKNHKNYCLINAGDSTMDDMANNDMGSISPSSESQKSYNNPTEVQIAVDFTTYNQEEIEPQDN